MVAEASVTKVTVYNHYRAKGELLAASLHALDERFFSWFVHEVQVSTDGPRGRLLAVFDVLDLFRRRDFRGCAFINATVELASLRHPAGAAVMTHKTRCRHYFPRPGWGQSLPSVGGVLLVGHPGVFHVQAHELKDSC